MSWWSDANEAEDPDRLCQEIKEIGRGVRKLGRAVAGEIKGDRRKGDQKGEAR